MNADLLHAFDLGIVGEIGQSGFQTASARHTHFVMATEVGPVRSSGLCPGGLKLPSESSDAMAVNEILKRWGIDLRPIGASL